MVTISIKSPDGAYLIGGGIGIPPMLGLLKAMGYGGKIL